MLSAYMQEAIAIRVSRKMDQTPDFAVLLLDRVNGGGDFVGLSPLRHEKSPNSAIFWPKSRNGHGTVEAIDIPQTSQLNTRRWLGIVAWANSRLSWPDKYWTYEIERLK
jgi:hypothetical protein